MKYDNTPENCQAWRNRARDRADELAKYITKKLEEGYEKFKRGEPLD